MPLPRSLARRIAAAGLASALVLTSACSDDGDDVATEDTSTAAGSADTTADTAGTVEELTIEDVWIRESPMVTGAAAGYAVITSPVDDELLSVRVDPAIAGTVELHETVAADMGDDADDDHANDGTADDGTADDGMDADDMDAADMDADDMEATDDTDGGHGAMTMRQVASIPLPAGTQVVLAPGGLHIMFLEVATQLEAGQSVELTLVFAEAGEVTVTAEVRKS